MGLSLYPKRMKSISRIAAGRKAYHSGERWQTLFQNCAIRQGFHCIRIHDGCKTVQRRLIRMPQCFDFILSGSDKRIAFIDAKSCKTKRFSFSAKVSHQIRDLLALEKHGALAGYCVFFETSAEIVFFSASQLHAMIERTSLGPEDGKILGLEMNFDIGKMFL